MPAAYLGPLARLQVLVMLEEALDRRVELGTGVEPSSAHHRLERGQRFDAASRILAEDEQVRGGTGLEACETFLAESVSGTDGAIGPSLFEGNPGPDEKGDLRVDRRAGNDEGLLGVGAEEAEKRLEEAGTSIRKVVGHGPPDRDKPAS